MSGPGRQVAVLVVALAVWAAIGEPAIWAAVLAYLIAWAALSYGSQRVSLGLARWQLVLAGALVAAPGLAMLVRQWDAIVEAEGIVGAIAQSRDRWRLELTPSIAPPLVSAAEPQTFWVWAPGGARVKVRLGPRGEALVAERIGEGLFRLDYDPRRDGLPSPGEGEVEAQIDVDGAVATRAMHAVTPLAHPRWLRVAPEPGLRACTVSEETDELWVIGARGIERRVAVGDGPTDCAWLDAERIAVTHRHDAHVWQVSGDQAEPWVLLGPDQRRAAARRGELAVTVGSSRSRVAVIPSDPDPAAATVDLPATGDWIDWRDDGSLIVTTRDGTVRRVQRRGIGWRLDDGAAVIGIAPVTLALAPDGATAWVAATDYASAGRRGRLGNHFIQDQLLAIDTATMRVVAQVPTARRSRRQTAPGDFDRGSSPMGIALPRDGSLVVAFAGTDEVWRLAHAGAPPAIVPLDDTSLIAPHGIAVLGDGTWLVTSPAGGTIGIAPPGRERRFARAISVAPTGGELLRENQAALQRRVGEHGFYEATRSGIACQSCHQHADSDGSSHDLGDPRPLPTLSVRGLAGTAPYLRDGSYPRLRDLDTLSHGLYRGFRRRMRARGESLEAFVSSLVRPPSRAARDPGRERRGFEVFVRAQCPTCHAPPAFTTLGQIPARTVFPDAPAAAYETLDVPSLLSVGATAPYLSDGRAATLEQVLREHNRANRHGDTRALADEEIADLVVFLESL